MLQSNNKPFFLDFFAGSGLVCEGLKDYFTPVWANDICEKKAEVFCANHPKEILWLGPIEKVKGTELPNAILAWGSFPCQDLSLAGNIGGISSSRSGLVWHWLRVINEMKKKPKILVAENVVGLVSANQGEDYKKLHKSLTTMGYKVGALIIDACYWVPQSRKRVFIVAVDEEIDTNELESEGPIWCHPNSIRRVARSLSIWVWWNIPEPTINRPTLESIIDFDAPCDDLEKTKKLLALIPLRHREMLREAVLQGNSVFPGYKRIRNGKQVLELRFDGLAGCLRTPEGGSSRQFLVLYRNGSFSTRLITVKEAAALMGVRDTYIIPGTYNEGYKAMGDAVAVPVTRYLAEHLLLPIAKKEGGLWN